MAYTKNTWVTGDIVTSEKLNHMEDGIANAGGVLVINDTDGTLDKTWQEIYDAMSAGKICVVRQTLEGEIATAIVKSAAFIAPAGKYNVLVDNDIYVASSPTEYPALDFNGGSPVG